MDVGCGAMTQERAQTAAEGAQTEPQRLTAIRTRAAVMVAFAVLFAASETVLLLAAALQGLWLALTGAPNPHVARLVGGPAPSWRF